MGYDQGSSVVSTKGATASAVNILERFSKKGSVPLYSCIFVVFIALILVCLCVSVGVYLNPSLEWDNSTQVKNPIIDFLSLGAIINLRLKGTVVMQDLQTFNQYRSLLNESKIRSYISE